MAQPRKKKRPWRRKDWAEARVLRSELDYAAEPLMLSRGNSIEPLVDGEQTYTAMLDAITEATSYIHLETYILEDDAIGRTFSRLLRERSRAGVKVRVMFDGFGSLTLSSGFIGELEDAGIEVHEFRPLVVWKIARWSHRDHRKILVVDGRVAFTGGLNIGHEYAPPSVGGVNWRDTHCRVVGPVVAQLDTLFVTAWVRETERELVGYAPPRPTAAEGADMRAVALANGFLNRRTAIRRAYLNAIRCARESIYIANAYFVPDPGIRRALVRAARRGVAVHVVTNEHSDIKSVQYAGESLYNKLLKGGVRLHLFHTRMMHSKIAVIDGVWSAIGSYNLDYVSLLSNLEVMIQAVDRDLGQQMINVFKDDLNECHELSLTEWKRRPWWRKLAEWFFYKFRRWL